MGRSECHLLEREMTVVTLAVLACARSAFVAVGFEQTSVHEAASWVGSDVGENLAQGTLGAGWP